MSKAVPRYVEIADDLREQIAQGQLRPGDRLPTEPELGATYRASRTTVREAVKRLTHAGLISVSPGRGRGAVVREWSTLTYFASRAELPGVLVGPDAFFAEAIAQGSVPSQTIIVTTERLPADIAALLHVKAGTRAARRLCVRSIDGLKNSLQDTWYPWWLTADCPELSRPADVKQGTTRLLEERGYRQDAFFDLNSARMPTTKETELLGIASGTPILEHRRTGFTSDRRPVRLSFNVFAGDRSTVAYTIGDGNALPEGRL